ncbi:MAG: glycoside hydrolase family 20 zincin-like fold domain-containing protein [Chloroflexota bacterium]|nr:glycoside hydrolase family 20 zincin-like fold domain-containing protein [Chloroflexota bacterium]
MDTSNLPLIPVPRQFDLTGDTFQLAPDRLIIIDSIDPQALWFSAQQLQDALRAFAEVRWQIVSGTVVPADQVGVNLSIVPGSVPHEQGYSLTITPGRIDVIASRPAGVYYAVQTLRQLLQQRADSLPALRCTDWPDFPNRGVMLDISRDKVPTMETLFDLVDLLASLKINQFQLYTEHTFAYRNHPTVWADASPMTGEQILALDAYCRDRYIELVPNQNTFGHMHRWLEHDAYKQLAEVLDGFDTPWGWHEGPYSISPSVPGSIDLVRDMLDELLPHFTSQQANVGCDETFDIGQGLSKNLVAERGAGQVYLDFLLKIYREVKARGYTMQFWGDIVMEHPELVSELPTDAIALEWGYEAGHKFEEHGARYHAAGIPFYVVPGTSSWRTIVGRTDNAMENLRNAARNGLKHGAVGYLNTDWGDDGHWQPLPVSYLGFLYGAALSWHGETNIALDIAQALNHYAFCDESGQMGSIVFELGNLYQDIGFPAPNSSALFSAMLYRPQILRERIGAIDDLDATQERIRVTEAKLDDLEQRLSQSNCQRPDAALIDQEFRWAINMLRHSCQRLRWLIGIVPDGPEIRQDLAGQADALIAGYDHIWHARNRPGGYEESVGRLKRMRDDYQNPPGQ